MCIGIIGSTIDQGICFKIDFKSEPVETELAIAERNEYIKALK